tara:strand:- start:787 stop:1395 length:609 start_codon:yes stop_codon:yes gene_type:complete
MGGTDYIERIKATRKEDILESFDNELERLYKEKSSHSCRHDDIYDGDAESFAGIKILDIIAKDEEEAEKLIWEKAEKWGPAIGIRYYPKNFVKRSEHKKLNNKMKVLSGFIKARDKRKEKIEKILKTIKEKPETNTTSCVTCKSKITNKYLLNFLNLKNKCIVCNGNFINTKSCDEKYINAKSKYDSVEHVYEALWGGMVAI